MKLEATPPVREVFTISNRACGLYPYTKSPYVVVRSVKTAFEIVNILLEMGQHSDPLYRINSAADRIRFIIRRITYGSGINDHEFEALYAIRQGKKTVTDIARDRASVPATSLTIRKLEKNGFVSKSTGSDPRLRLLALTPKGDEIVDRIDQEIDRMAAANYQAGDQSRDLIDKVIKPWG